MSSLVQFWVNTLSEFYTGTAIPDAPKHTGRLPLSDSEEKLPIPPTSMYADEAPILEAALVSEQMHYRHLNTPLNTVFFSQSNIDSLQEQLQDRISEMSNGKFKIGRQSESDLLLIMRSYYLQHADNNPDEVARELIQLNQRVVAFASNRIMVELVAYERYRKDILDFPEPLDLPKDMHIKGTRTGELKSFF
jgi:hypothetical protein